MSSFAPNYPLSPLPLQVRWFSPCRVPPPFIKWGVFCDMIMQSDVCHPRNGIYRKSRSVIIAIFTAFFFDFGKKVTPFLAPFHGVWVREGKQVGCQSFCFRPSLLLHSSPRRSPIQRKQDVEMDLNCSHFPGFHLQIFSRWIYTALDSFYIVIRIYINSCYVFHSASPARRLSPSRSPSPKRMLK